MNNRALLTFVFSLLVVLNGISAALENTEEDNLALLKLNQDRQAGANTVESDS